MSPQRARHKILAPAVDIRVSPVWSGGRYVVRLAVGTRAPVDLPLDQAARLVADLAAAVRLAQHHEGGSAECASAR